MEFELKEGTIDDPLKAREQLRELFSSQHLAVLSTYGNGHPYCNLIAFACSEDLGQLIFATTRETRKYENIQSGAQVSMLIDNRTNQVSDFREAKAVTVIGKAEEVSGEKREELMDIYLHKHPTLSEFVRSSSCALIRVEVEQYLIASRFQHIVVLSMRGQV